MLLRPEVGTHRLGVFQAAVEVGADHRLVAVISNRQRFTDDRNEPFQVPRGCLTLDHSLIGLIIWAYKADGEGRLKQNGSTRDMRPWTSCPASCCGGRARFSTRRGLRSRSKTISTSSLSIPVAPPSVQAENTIERNVRAWREEPTDHRSAYTDESWEGRPAGAHGMQPRMIQMFSKLGLNPRNVPAANVVFVRSTDESALEKEKEELLRAPWPVHKAVLGSLGIRCVLALGTTVGRWGRQTLDANELIEEFFEDNERKSKSTAHRAEDGRLVVTVTHPGRADWRNPAADRSGLVRNTLNVARSSQCAARGVMNNS